MQLRKKSNYSKIIGNDGIRNKLRRTKILIYFLGGKKEQKSIR